MTQKGNLRYLEKLRWAAKINRNKMTKSESKIWYEFLKNRPMNYKFTRQKPIFRFVLDFYCSELLLAIEVDGDSHDFRASQDFERDKYLARMNIKTLRFRNEDVLNNFFKINFRICRRFIKK